MRPMKAFDIVKMRLAAQRLVGKKLKDPAEVVRLLGAVQAQDFPAAKWALALRMEKTTDRSVESAFDAGTILRTHVLRPTWHFVLPEDITWMLELTAPRVKKILSYYDHHLGLDPGVVRKSNTILAKVLRGNNFLTRAELGDALEKNSVRARGQRLGHILSYAELDGVICSGPKRGKQFTYALLEERAPKTKLLKRDDALRTLAQRYFTSHGPAQLKDFAWWSGLTIQDARDGIDLSGSKVANEIIDGKTYWFSSSPRTAAAKSPAVLLLSIFDEYTIAYRDRTAFAGDGYVEKLLSMGSTVTSVFTVDGKIAGVWKRIFGKGKVEVSIKPLRRLEKGEQDAVEQAAFRYGRFLELPIAYTMQSGRTNRKERS